MATKKTAPYGLKKDGTPKKRPGPKKGGKGAVVKNAITPLPRGKRPRSRAGNYEGRVKAARTRHALEKMRDESDSTTQASPFARMDQQFLGLTYPIPAGTRFMVEDSRPEFFDATNAGRAWEPSIQAMLPDGLDLPSMIRWVANNLHPGDVRTYVLRAGGHANLEFALNEKGERIPRPAVVFKSVPRKPVEPGSPAAILDAMKQMINARSAIGIIADWGMAMAKPEIVDAATDARQAIDALAKTYSASPEEIEKAMGELAPNLRKHVLSVVSGMNDKEKDILRKRGVLKDQPSGEITADEIRIEAVRSGNGPEARPAPPDAPTANECRTED